MPFFVAGLFVTAFLIHRREARVVAAEVASARADIEKTPPGFERPAEYVRRLRAIDVAQASPKLRQTFAAYADAMERSLELMKQHQDTTAADQICAQKAKELADTIDNGR